MSTKTFDEFICKQGLRAVSLTFGVSFTSLSVSHEDTAAGVLGAVLLAAFAIYPAPTPPPKDKPEDSQ